MNVHLSPRDPHTVSFIASEVARYAAMHAAAPDMNCWRTMMEENFLQLAAALGMPVSLTQKQKADA